MVVAIPACLTHRRALHGFEEHIRESSPETLEAWKKMYEEWQTSSDKSKDCPFVAPRNGAFPFLAKHCIPCLLTSTLELTLGDVRLRLTREEQERGFTAVQGREETGETAFLVLGLDIAVAQ